MQVFSLLLNIHQKLITEGKEIPVLLGNEDVIGVCKLRVIENKVVGKVQLDDGGMSGIHFYYQIYPMPQNPIKNIQINFVRLPLPNSNCNESIEKLN
ncbi:MAG: hypothetical protein QM802_10100 [Agriterribacter sp.]